jgi:hypothetical protein
MAASMGKAKILDHISRLFYHAGQQTTNVNNVNNETQGSFKETGDSQEIQLSPQKPVQLPKIEPGSRKIQRGRLQAYLALPPYSPNSE